MRKAVKFTEGVKSLRSSSSIRSLSYLSSSSYESIVDALKEESNSLSHLRQIHALVITNGFSSKSVLACRLISYYASLCGIEDAQKLFGFLPKRTVNAYSIMLKAYVDRHQYHMVFELYSQMLSTEEISPDPVTFSIVLKACTALRSLWVGRIVHVHVLVTGSESDLRLATDLLHLYSKCGCITSAQKLFQLMPQKDAVVWTAMIDGHLRSGAYDEALNLFFRMRESGLKANAVTWNALIAGFARDGLMSDALCQFRLMQVDGVRPDKVSLCTIFPLFSKSAILKPGLEAHAYVVRNCLESDLFIVSTLVDMYAKCGNLELARCLFDRVVVRDAGLWNAIIVGYGVHGNCKESLSLFHQMRISGIRPNEITFTSILSACSHGGMVTEGLWVFDLMVSQYKVAACNEHYACMVDMLGRAGQLEEAFAFITRMAIKPKKDVWGAFLSACRIHTDAKFVEIAAQHMFGSNITGANAGYFVMMSNIYAENGRWGEMAKLRTQIRDGGLKKRTGCSWIEVGDSVHMFNMADISHSQSDQIYAWLGHLNAVISTIQPDEI